MTRALAFLQREVPAWSRENGCFSCHNNGDAARALMEARRRGFSIPPDSLQETEAWLSRPEAWAGNKGDPGFSDQRLADIQFGAALLGLSRPRHPQTHSALVTAARLIAARQDDDGSWRIEPQNDVGSPATYGTALATFMAWRVLQAAPLPESAAARQRARDWLNQLTPDNTIASAVVVWWANEHSAEKNKDRARAAFHWLCAAQSSDGGWGPYRDTPAEVFDTALALLALNTLEKEPGLEERIQRGRNFLVKAQLSDGSWPATTRPPGGQSYAQTLSTTGWAVLALLATEELTSKSP